jgi:tellurite methyltransferase
MEKSSSEIIYDEIYSKEESAFGGPEKSPDDFVVEIPKHLVGGVALELGAGQGRNALFLAKHGFEIEAVDISSVAVDQINETAESEGLKVKAFKKDVNENIDGMYDCVVSTLMFHHLKKDDALKVITQMQEHTKREGLNVITIFSNESGFYKITPQYFFPTGEEVKEIYKDWQVIDYEEVSSPARKKDKDGNTVYNIVIKIIAKK